MTNALAILNDNNINIWDDQTKLQEIKKIFAPKVSDLEFAVFVGMGKATGLNPFLKEIWAVKYDSSAAQIFIGRDGYRKSAQRSPLYDYHIVDAVYSNDTFDVVNGEVTHRYNLKDRGALAGAFCLTQRKGASRPSYVFVDIKEYDKKQSVWKEKPATMIKKVAEAQGLRGSFQELFAGTYSEDELDPNQSDDASSRLETLKEKLAAKSAGAIYNNETGEVIGATRNGHVSVDTSSNANNQPQIEFAQILTKISQAKNDDDIDLINDLRRGVTLSKEEENEVNKAIYQAKKTFIKG